MARRLTGRLSQRTPDGKWRYTLAETARGEAGFWTIEKYIRRQQNIVAQYIFTRLMLDLCEGLEMAPGPRVGMQWWEKGVIDLVGAQEAAVVAAEEER